MAEKKEEKAEMKVISREHFTDLLEGGQEEFRIEAVVGSKKRKISEDAPFDRDDPMSYVLVKLIFDEIGIYAKGDFSAHDIAEAIRKYEPKVAERKELREKLMDALLGNMSIEELQERVGLVEKVLTAKK